MLTTWLNPKERSPCQYSEFKVIDVEQINELSEDVRSYLADLICIERFEPKFLADVAECLGWNDTNQLILAKKMPKKANAKRGEFGETLTNAILEQFHGYKIPVRKLRFKITSGQSLPATDSLALRLEQGSISEVCYIESKLRTCHDDGVAVDGCNQLQDDYLCKLPDILTFVASQLYERNDPLYEPFKIYMRDRRDTKDRDTFRLSLCWDSLQWQEKVLEKLQENVGSLPKLTIYAIRLKNLRQITEEVFAAIGISEVSDDD